MNWPERLEYFPMVPFAVGAAIGIHKSTNHRIRGLAIFGRIAPRETDNA